MVLVVVIHKEEEEEKDSKEERKDFGNLQNRIFGKQFHKSLASRNPFGISSSHSLMVHVTVTAVTAKAKEENLMFWNC